MHTSHHYYLVIHTSHYYYLVMHTPHHYSDWMTPNSTMCLFLCDGLIMTIPMILVGAVKLVLLHSVQLQQFEES